jgi:hypothetical protein
MGDIVIYGQVRVAFVTTIAAPAAPTVAELGAGTELGSYIAPGGMEGFEASTEEVDTSALDSTFNTKRPGRTAYSGTALVLKKQTETDTTFAALDAKLTDGFLVVRLGVDKATAWTAAQVVQVYPVSTGQWTPLPVEANPVYRYRVPMPVTGEPNLTAVVAAGGGG